MRTGFLEFGRLDIVSLWYGRRPQGFTLLGLVRPPLIRFHPFFVLAAGHAALPAWPKGL
jgi:hypothetical protein